MTSSVTDKQAAAGSRQPKQSGGGATYVAVLTGPVAPSQTSGPLKPTAMDLDPSKPGVSVETTNRRMASDMSGPLSGMPDGTTLNAQVANAAIQQESVLTRHPFLFQVLVKTVPSWSGCGRSALTV